MSTPHDRDNPFAPPKAAVLEPSSASAGEFVAEGVKVTAGRGAAWYSEGWGKFRLAPGTWILIALVFIVMWIVLGIIPLGGLVSSLLYPIFVAGLMLGCRKLEDGDSLAFKDLFSGFSANTGNLLLVGLLYLAAVFAIGMLVGIGAALTIPLMGTTGGAGRGMGQLMAMAPVFIAIVLVAMALMLPVVMAFWFAPALVVFHDAQPMAALRASFAGCLKNFGALLVYWVIGLFFMILAMIPVGLGFLVFVPVMWGSMYAGYRDIFLRHD